MKSQQLDTCRIAQQPQIALIVARWHAEIVDQFKTSFLDEFQENDGRHVSVFEVPGAFEIPLLAMQLASSGDYAAIVAGAFVVDGGIYRHEFVASSVIDGLMRTQLDTGVPVFSGVLTPKEFNSEAHTAFFAKHFVVKGREAAQACGLTLSRYRELCAA